MRRTLIVALAILLICSPSFAQEREEKGEAKKTGIVIGKVIWEGHDLSQVTVQVYRDSALKELYSTGILLNKKGDYQLELEPGRYYIAAFVDVNKSGTMDEGDGIGIYGITDWGDPNQDKRSVEIKGGELITDADIHISAVLAYVDGKLQVVPAKEFEAKPSLQEELERISTGISGRVILEKGELKNGIVFAYTDLSWKYRVGQAQVEPDGSFRMNVPPGKYYILAVIDLNNSNLFDVGDMFGIYGIENLKAPDAFPRPVLVEPRRFTGDIQVKIVGRRLEGGGIIALEDEPQRTVFEAKSAKVKGKVIWDGRSMERCVVQFYRDPTFTQAIEAVGTASDGSFTIMLPPGDYYVLANVDGDGDGKYSSGDGLGAYGSDDITRHPPLRLNLKQGVNPDLKIRITGLFTEEGQIISLNPESQEEEISPIPSGITGRVIWDGREPKSALILVSKSPDFQSPAVIPVQLNEDGSYSLDLLPGTYYLMAVIDSDSDGKAGGGDGFGIYGTMNPISGPPVPVSVFQERRTPYINIYIRGAFTDDSGNTALIDDANRSNIKAKYGQPEDIFSYTDMGKQIEEWYYWREGIAFKFEQSGLGWVLKESEKFTPKNLDKLSQKEEEKLGLPFNLLYYSLDGIVWGLAPNGMRQPLGFGNDPTSTTDGSYLVYIDLDGHIRLSSAEEVEGRIIFRRSERAEQPVISPDGDFIAYIKRIGDQRKLFIRFIQTNDEIQVPTSANLISDPSWNLNSELLAFAAAGAVESNPAPPGSKKTSDEKVQRDIYSYDIVSNQIDPLVLSPADDAEPAWCPTDPNKLAFSRETDGNRQIWVITFPRNRPPQEEQLTKYGGEHPSWLPDGTGIVYEVNGQIWVVDLRTKLSRPIMIDGEPIFGFYPFVR